MEGRLDGFGNVLGALDEEVVLGDRHRDAADIGFLEAVGSDERGIDLSGDRDHRHRVQVGIGQWGDQVGRTRAGGRDTDPDPSGGDGVALGGVPGALFVADQDVANGRIEKRIVCRQDCPARNAEGYFHAATLQ
ncbi:hypothetical protein SDC9_127022 [bioreactor metagenome]|uniref:Uncharacterized protein n=1 Tax=bioreactor metagenome TaxID=1076179 RepID=A0A645CSV9_9ZZZZ